MLRRKERFLCALLALVMALLCGAALAEPAEAPLPAEETPVAEISLDGYELTYDALLPETIAYVVPEDTPEPDLQFTIALRGEDEPPVPLFLMQIEQDVGDWVVVLTDEAGHIVPVAFAADLPPEDLSEEEAAAFAAAQQEVHVLLATLKLQAVPAPVDDSDAKVRKIETDTLTLTYSARHSLLAARETADSALEFHMPLAGQDATVFTLVPDSMEGDIVMMLTDGTGRKVPVAFLMAALPEGISAEEAQSFYIHQEAVAEVMASLTLR